jgi:hypothetical protein
MARSILLALALAAAASAAPVDLHARALPTPVDAPTARTYLLQLTVAAEVNSPAYARSQFKTWDTISGTCDTRESGRPPSVSVAFAVG